MATPQLAQKARSELLSASLDLPVPALFSTVLLMLFTPPIQSMRQDMPPGDLVLTKTRDPTGYATHPAVPTRAHIYTPEYHWTEFWRAVLGLLEFLTKKIDELQSAAGIRPLIKEVSTLTTLQFPSKFL